MSNSNTIDLWLLGSNHRLGCPSDKEEALKYAAAELEQRFKAVQKQNSRLDSQKVAILSALQMMQELIELNKSLQHYQQREADAQQIMTELNQCLDTVLD